MDHCNEQRQWNCNQEKEPDSPRRHPLCLSLAGLGRGPVGRLELSGNEENMCRSAEATAVGIKLTGDAILCPVKAAMWLKRAGRHYNTQASEPAMSSGTNGGISSSALVSVIKKLAKSMGMDPNLYSSHSVRIGGATVLLNAGCHPLIIKLLGRWLSNCFESYPVLLASGTKGVAAMMC